PPSPSPPRAFAAGDRLLLLDASGQYDIFTVTGIDGMGLAVRHHGTHPSGSYVADTPVVAVESASISLNRSSGTLRLYDGDANDLPVLDDVVDLRVWYFGEGEPPVWPRPPDGEANCLYAGARTHHTPFLSLLCAP